MYPNSTLINPPLPSNINSLLLIVRSSPIFTVYHCLVNKLLIAKP